MTCMHEKADIPIGRLVMLFSADGVGCYKCKSRLMLPGRTRLIVFSVFWLLALSPLVGMNPFVTGGLVSIATWVGIPWICKAQLKVSSVPGEGA